MQSPLNAIRLLCGLSPLLLVGCLTGTPYPYNGYNGYPPGSYAVPPGGTLPPAGGQNIVPQPRDGNLGPPGSPGGSQGSGLGAPQPGGRQPTYEANNNRKNATGNKLVPDYQDPNRVPSTDAEGSGTGTTNQGTNQSPGSSRSGDDNGGVQSPFGPGADTNTPSATTPTGARGAGQEGSPIRLTNGEQSRQPAEPPRFQPPQNIQPVEPKGVTLPPGDSVASPKTTTTTLPPNPYDYDRKNYTWVRGKVDYDEDTKTWQIIYSLNPEDQYGGTLTLMDDPKLRILRNNDVVLIEGRVDTTSTDVRGKPRYRIIKLFGPLVPKSHLPKNLFPDSTPESAPAADRNARS